ncbi:MAG: histidine kinase [Bacteroidales bacterium]|nr:histidine kinase [Bacteroidales bacterium]
MLNPIVSNKKHFLIYVLSMGFILLAHFIILYFSFNFSLEIAISDAAIYTTMIFLLGIGIWYIVKYLAISEQKYHLILADHLITGGILVLIWLFSGYYSLSLIFKDETRYLNFLDDSLPWRFVYLIMVYALLVMIYYLINYYRQYHEKVLQESELKQTIQQSELNMLKSQINPHFLFNSLNSIHSLILADSEKASEMLMELSEFLRYTVRKDHNEQVSLKSELENIEKYLDIEKIRFGNRLVVEEEIDEACLNCKIPNMILQPIYENAIKHGVNESTDTVTISTKCSPVNGDLKISIGNNYSPGNLSKRGEGLGLENIKKRLKLHFKRSDLLEIEKSSFYFTVHIIIPKIEPEKIES